MALKCRIKSAVLILALDSKGGEPVKVLVVEAEETTRTLMGVMLTKLGYKIGLASSCADGLRMFSDQGPYDVVLIALKFMRGSRAGGANFIDSLLERNAQQHIAFITGSPVLRKPFTLQEVDDFMGAFRRPGESRFG
jgi:CheY-like chemotaxis protein